jgi:hypothetical protein
LRSSTCICGTLANLFSFNIDYKLQFFGSPDH